MIYSYINTSGNQENDNLCGNTAKRFHTILSFFQTVYQYQKMFSYFFYNAAENTLTEEWRGIFRVDIELYIIIGNNKPSVTLSGILQTNDLLSTKIHQFTILEDYSKVSD